MKFFQPEVHRVYLQKCKAHKVEKGEVLRNAEAASKTLHSTIFKSRPRLLKCTLSDQHLIVLEAASQTRLQKYIRENMCLKLLVLSLTEVGRRRQGFSNERHG